MMKALNDLCIKISLCNRMSLVSMLHHKDRLVPSSCQSTSFASFVIFPYFSLFFTFGSIVTKFVVKFKPLKDSKYAVTQIRGDSCYAVAQDINGKWKSGQKVSY